MLMQRPHSRTISLATAAVLMLPVACGSPTDVRSEPRHCSRTSEFGNTGCADIEGVVLDASSHGVAGISVGARFLASPVVIDRAVPGMLGDAAATTDRDGRFRLRITRYSGGPPSAGPDTLSVLVNAEDTRQIGGGVLPTVRGSVLTQVTLAPVGATPAVVTITIRLPLP